MGARHKATVAAEALLDGEAEALTRKAVEMALAGDGTALRLCLDRIIPPRRERPVRFKMPVLQSSADAVAAMAAIAAAVAQGHLTPGEASELHCQRHFPSTVARARTRASHSVSRPESRGMILDDLPFRLALDGLRGMGAEIGSEIPWQKIVTASPSGSGSAPAASRLPPILGLRRGGGLPLEIGNRVGSAAGKRYDAVFPITRTGALVSPVEGYGCSS